MYRATSYPYGRPMTGYLAYDAWNEHLADLRRAAARHAAAGRPRRPAAKRPARTGLRRLREALAG
jgi:hypothetical protein